VIESFERTFPSTPILVVSAYVEEELTRRGISQGRHRFLRKPFSNEEVCEVVDQLLGKTTPPARPPITGPREE
jgi:CheY-like chemotaxis protein